MAPDVRAFKREYCVWNLDKNTLCRYVKRWTNTLEREWHPDVARVLNGSLTFNGTNAEQFNLAASMAETFIMAHLDFKGEKGERLQKRMEEARLNGVLVPCNGRALLNYLLQWIIINDEGEQQRAREALRSIVLLPNYDIEMLEEVFWWATNLRARLPDAERTAECNVRARMIDGMKGELEPRKAVLQSQIAMATMSGRNLNDAEFIKLLATQLSQYRASAGIVCDGSGAIEIVVNGSDGRSSPTPPIVPVIWPITGGTVGADKVIDLTTINAASVVSLRALMHGQSLSINQWALGASSVATPLCCVLAAKPYLLPADPPPTGMIRVLVDGGSSCNAFPDRSGFVSSAPRPPTSTELKVGNPDAPLRIVEECSIEVPLRRPGQPPKLLPETDVLIVPGIMHFVLSEGKYLDEHDVEFDKKTMLVRWPNDSDTAPIYRHGDLFYVHAAIDTGDGEVCMMVVSDRRKRQALLWNARLGGISVDQAGMLHDAVKGLEHGINDQSAAAIETCELDKTAIDHCELRELTRMRTPSLPGPTPENHLAQKPGELLVLDGWPLPHKAIGTGHDYLELGADEMSGYGFVASTSKHTADEWLLFVRSVVAASTIINPDFVLRAVRTDGAGEFRNADGWAKQLLLLQPPVQAQRSPSRHHHAVGKASAMQLELARISNHQMQRVGRNTSFLVHSIKYANVLRNVRPLRDGNTRYKLFSGGKDTDVSLLRVWGCDAFALVEKEARTHLAPGTVSVKGVFVGIEGKTWKVWADGREWPTQHCHFFESSLLAVGVGSAKLLVDVGTQTLASDLVRPTTTAIATGKQPFMRGLGAGRAATRSMAPSHEMLSMSNSTPALLLMGSTLTPEMYSLTLPSHLADAIGFESIEFGYEGHDWLTSVNLRMDDGCRIEVPEPYDDGEPQVNMAMITLKTANGDSYQMPSPTTPKQAMQTPQAAQWEQVIKSHIARIELDGARPVPISRAKAELGEGGTIGRSLLRLRVKPNPDDGTLSKLQARGCYDGREWGNDEPTITHQLPPEGERMILAEAAIEERIIVRGDVKNAYPHAEWLSTQKVFMHMFPDYEQYTEDGELMVYELTSPLFGAPPAGGCWEAWLNGAVEKAGGVKSLSMQALFHFPCGTTAARMGTIVDDMLITVPRDTPELARRIMASVDEACKGDVKWDWDPIAFSFGGPQILRNVKARTVSISITLKIEAAVATYAPHLIGSTEEVKQVASQEALDALVMPPKAERTPKLSKVQRAIAAEIGLFIYFMEYFVAIVRPVHALSTVMSYPPVAESRVVLGSLWRYMYSNRFEANTFGGALAATHQLEAGVGFMPLESVPAAERILITDATWTGSEQRSLKAYAFKWAGGLILHRLTSIHAIMPSSFSAEAEALHDGFEAADYLTDTLIEMGQVAPSAMLSLSDNDGLVKTAQLRAKGGSKLHRRKLGIILAAVGKERFRVKHVGDAQMPVDFMTKLVSQPKLRKSIDYLYNTGNAVKRAVGFTA